MGIVYNGYQLNSLPNQAVKLAASFMHRTHLLSLHLQNNQDWHNTAHVATPAVDKQATQTIAVTADLSGACIKR
jgi:hypothetical protein